MEVLETASRQRWLEDRRCGVGGSDSAAVLGLSPYKSPYELWAEKLGRIPEAEENEAMEFGRKLEPIVLSTLAERTGRTVTPWPQTDVFRHRERDFMLCTPDAFQSDEGLGRGIVQAKTCSAFLADAWRDEPPLPFQVQIQHEMEVTGCSWGTLCVLVGGQKFAWFDVNRNDEFTAALVEKESEFWGYVTRREPPPVDGSESWSRTWKALHPADNGECVELPEEAEMWDDELAGIKDQLRDLDIRKAMVTNRFKDAIGDNTFGVLPNGQKYTLKTQTRKAYSVEEATYRVLRRSKG